MKISFLLLCTFLGTLISAQSPSIGIPDSTMNITLTGSNNQYSNPNPLLHNGTVFTNAPTAVLISPNSDKSDYLYLYDLDLNVPANATITGVEVYHNRGGCNGGSYVIDTIYLAYNQSMIGNMKRDSANNATDTLGWANDNWGAALTPAIVNDNSFGIILQSTAYGICTFGQFNIQVKVYYCLTSSLEGIPDSAQNIALAGSTNQYGFSNPIGHNGTAFTNAPTAVLISPNSDKSDYLYFYDLDLNVPTNATITGVEVLHTRGGCNSGSYVIDTMYLAYNQAKIGNMKRDSANNATDTLGGANDNWGAVLTSAMVNDNSFGIILHSTAYGICTFGQFDLRVKLHYCDAASNTKVITEPVVWAQLSPNPVSNVFTLKVSNIFVGEPYQIYNLNGQVLDSGIINDSMTEIDISNMNMGMYFIKMGGTTFKVIKFVKQ